jgi:hypothetical protein
MAIPSELDGAILRTLLYADIFQFPMRLPEIHHFLIGREVPLASVEDRLMHSGGLAEHVEQCEAMFGLRLRAYPIERRIVREAISTRLWDQAGRWAAILVRLPFVRMVALTGSLAMRNARTLHDDLDFLIVSVPGRVWTARAAAIVIVRLARLFHVNLCPNYVLSESALEQERRDLFMAHEIAQMVPLSGLPIYQTMRAANAWTQDYLPNAAAPFYTADLLAGKPLLEPLLRGRLGDSFESWERDRKIRRFLPESRRAGASATLDADHVKGHFNDYGYPTLERYHQRLKQYDLEA